MFANTLPLNQAPMLSLRGESATRLESPALQFDARVQVPRERMPGTNDLALSRNIAYLAAEERRSLPRQGLPSFNSSRVALAVLLRVARDMQGRRTGMRNASVHISRE